MVGYSNIAVHACHQQRRARVQSTELSHFPTIVLPEAFFVPCGEPGPLFCALRKRRGARGSCCMKDFIQASAPHLSGEFMWAVLVGVLGLVACGGGREAAGDRAAAPAPGAPAAEGASIAPAPAAAGATAAADVTTVNVDAYLANPKTQQLFTQAKAQGGTCGDLANYADSLFHTMSSNLQGADGAGQSNCAAAMKTMLPIVLKALSQLAACMPQLNLADLPTLCNHQPAASAPAAPAQPTAATAKTVACSQITVFGKTFTDCP